MQRQKLYSLQRKGSFIVCEKEQNLRDQYLQWQKLIVQSFAFFCKEKLNNYNILYCPDCTDFHAASGGTYCFRYRTYQGWKTETQKWLIYTYYALTMIFAHGQKVFRMLIYLSPL